MAGPYTIDASVFINAFNTREAGHAESRRFLAELQARAIPIIAPTLALPEVAAAIRRGLGSGDLAREFTATLARLPHLVLVSLDEALAQQAAGLAAAYGLRGSDAVYGAAALRFASPLVTLDREQHDRLSPALRTHYPRDALSQAGW